MQFHCHSTEKIFKIEVEVKCGTRASEHPGQISDKQTPPNWYFTGDTEKCALDVSRKTLQTTIIHTAYYHLCRHHFCTGWLENAAAAHLVRTTRIGRVSRLPVFLGAFYERNVKWALRANSFPFRRLLSCFIHSYCAWWRFARGRSLRTLFRFW